AELAAIEADHDIMSAARHGANTERGCFGRAHEIYNGKEAIGRSACKLLHGIRRFCIDGSGSTGLERRFPLGLADVRHNCADGAERLKKAYSHEADAAGAYDRHGCRFYMGAELLDRAKGGQTGAGERRGLSRGQRGNIDKIFRVRDKDMIGVAASSV